MKEFDASPILDKAEDLEFAVAAGPAAERMLLQEPSTLSNRPGRILQLESLN